MAPSLLALASRLRAEAQLLESRRHQRLPYKRNTGLQFRFRPEGSLSCRSTGILEDSDQHRERDKVQGKRAVHTHKRAREGTSYVMGSSDCSGKQRQAEEDKDTTESTRGEMDGEQPEWHASHVNTSLVHLTWAHIDRKRGLRQHAEASLTQVGSGTLVSRKTSGGLKPPL
jgi:hypothetical protein